jgi:hypothetical protein
MAMKLNSLKTLAACAVLVLTATGASAESNLWLHVRVDGDHGEKVSINLPLSLVEKAIPMIPDEHLRDGEFVLDHHWGGDHHLTVSELRDLWNELKASPDMTFVTVEDRDETVRVSKSGGYLRVHADDDHERVEVRIPESVVDALLSGDGESINIRAAIEALAAHGEGELVTVSEDDEQVRVWIDSSAEAD